METLAKIAVIGAGGAFGAIARYLLNISPLASLFEKFPFPTFFINVTGSFLIGFFLIVLTDKVAVPENLRLAVMIGFLGAFTTFSTFELELFDLIREKFALTAFGYLFLSVAVGFAAVIAGIAVGRRF
ncbi:MAG: fluoride efflux transporter CrcB [Pyrinomonadaceae bacterium]|nr:fluoride efflux transporter CrcB [Pyrinomonadaceae bacterium]